MRRVDPRLAADRAIHLRQQRCGNLHKPNPTAQHCSGEADQITNHTTPEGNDNIAAFDLMFQQPFHASFELRPALCAFPCRKRQTDRSNTLRGQCRLKRGKMQRSDMRIGHDCYTWTFQQRRDLDPGTGKQVRANAHVISTTVQRNVYGFDHACTSNTSGRVFSASITRFAISSIDNPGSDTTLRSALA